MPNLEYFIKKSVIPNNTTSEEIATAVTNETGSGSLVFANSPALTGTPTAPTAAFETNTTQIATTAFVSTAVNNIKTIYETVKNVSGVTLPKGTPLHIIGNSGNEAEVIAADAALNYPAQLILNESLIDQAVGQAVAIGFINNVTVPDASLYSPGDEVYLAPGGGWTTTKPTGTNAIQKLGVILKVNVGNNTVSGILYSLGNNEDLPNLPQGKIWVGDANGVPTITDLPTGGVTNLSYTASPTNGIVVSDTGTDATITLATGTNAGLLAPADFTKLSNLSGTNTGDQTITLTGDVTGSGTGSFVATLSNTGVGAGTYRSVTVDAKGRVTAGTNPTTLSGYGITDALSNSTTSTQNGYFGDIYLYDDSTPSHYLQITNSANLTAQRTLSLNVNNANRTVSLSGNLTLANNLTTSGNFAVTLTATGTTNVTLPTSGTLATTSNNLSAFAATTSAQLAAVISDETGTGSLVFSSSPSLTGTPTAPTAVIGTNTTQIATTAFVQQELSSLGGGSGLTPVKITNANSPYAASSGELIQVDASGGAAVITAPASGSDVYFGVVDYGSSISNTNTVTVNRQGSDTFVDGVETSIVLNSANSFAFFSLDSSDTVYQIGPWSDAQDEGSLRETIIVSLGDEDTAIEVGTGIVTFRIPFSLTLEEIKASSNTAPTGANLIIDINQDGTSILSTKLSIDAGEKTSSTATTPAVISTSALVEDSEISFDFDQVGSSVAGAGIKVYLMGTRP